MKKLGIYIHIPFCLSKCLYCGFYSAEGSSLAEREAYIKELLADIEAYGREYGADYSVDTVFIGGGTPSILAEEQIGRLLAAVRSTFSVEEDAEITIEANPKTLTGSKLSAYRAFGVNRLSIGAQSLDDELLRTLGRVHTAADFEETFHLARESGFENINADLMFAVPGHTLESWDRTLRGITALSPEHVSFYSLQIEEDTPYYRMFTEGKLAQISDELDRKMYHRAIEILREAGYEQYEISSAAKPGRRCRHNLKYWSLDDYLGIGSGASSYMQGIRFTEAPFMEFHENTAEDDMSEFVFTGLRKVGGISLAEFKQRFGRAFWEVYGSRRQELLPFIEGGLLREEAGKLYLTEAGFDISNTVMAVFV